MSNKLNDQLYNQLNPLATDLDGQAKLRLKPGRDYLAPSGQRVYLLRVEGDLAICRAYGPYGATLHYPKSVLKAWEGE